MLTDRDISKAVHDYFNAWNSRDLSVLGATLSSKIVLQDWNVHVSGLQGVLKANGDIFDAFSEVNIAVDELYPCVSKLACACEITVRLNDVAKTELNVLDIIRFDAQLKVVSVRAYKL